MVYDKTPRIEEEARERISEFFPEALRRAIEFIQRVHGARKFRSGQGFQGTPHRCQGGHLAY